VLAVEGTFDDLAGGIARQRLTGGGRSDGVVRADQAGQQFLGASQVGLGGLD